MFVGAAMKDLKSVVQPTLVAIVRHYTMVAIVQQAGKYFTSSWVNIGEPKLLLNNSGHRITLSVKSESKYLQPQSLGLGPNPEK